MDQDPFGKSLEDTARDEPDRYVRRTEYDDTDYGASRTARNWIKIDQLAGPLRSVRQIAALVREKYGAIGVALRQRDGFQMLDPVTEAGVARTVGWGYAQAPSRPLGLVLAGPTAPARGVRIEPVRPFGVDPGARPDMRHAKLWRVFLVSVYGVLTDGVFPFGWEAPLSAKVRATELDTEDSATAQQRVQALVDPLDYVLDFVAATVLAFERYKPPKTPRLGLLISMGRRDQEVVVNGLRQDRRGESLVVRAGWATAIRQACGGLVPVLEVAHLAHEEQLIDHLVYLSTDSVAIDSEQLVTWVREHAGPGEWEYLPAIDGGVPCVLLAGSLCDRRTGRSVGRLVLAMPENAPARMLTVPNELDSSGQANVAPALGMEERVAVSNVVTAWAAENNFTGSCRRKTWYGWERFSSSAANIDQLELTFRMGAAIRFWNIEFTDEGPEGV